MMKENVRNKLTEKSLLHFFLDVDKDFNPPLSQRLNIEEYVNKLYSLSDFFCEYNVDGYLVGIVAIYLYDPNNDKAFIPFVAVKDSERGRGVAKKILSMAIASAKMKGKKEIGIATNNSIALHLYESLGFKKIDGDYDDIHHPQLILKL